MAAALESLDSGVRSATVSNLAVEHGPGREASMPLLSMALKDDSLRVRRLAMDVLAGLGQAMTDEDAQATLTRLHDASDDAAAWALVLANYYLGERTP